MSFVIGSDHVSGSQGSYASAGRGHHSGVRSAS